MLEAVDRTGLSGPGRGVSGPPADTQQLLDWLRSGRLTLVDATRAAVAPDAWDSLHPDVRARALEDFRRVVTGNAKAAVIFLRP